MTVKEESIEALAQGGDRGERSRDRLRGGERRPALGATRRGRELRRGDLARLPAAPDRAPGPLLLRALSGRGGDRGAARSPGAPGRERRPDRTVRAAVRIGGDLLRL